MRKLFVILLLFAFNTDYAEDVPMTQAEVDRIVDSELLMYEHDEDFQSAKKALIAGGVTKDMLAHGYYVSLQKTMNAERGSLDFQKFHSAVFCYVESVEESQLTNLLSIASATTNKANVAKVVRLYHARSPLSAPLIQWCSRNFATDKCDEFVRYDIILCFENTMKNLNVPQTLKNDILSCARRAVLTEPMAAFVADRILAVHEDGYVTSDLRRHAAEKIMSRKDCSMPNKVRQHFYELLKKDGLK